ncbi:hypothetical protein BH24CHL1_BH24CHL1_06580 [soil metagenome]
MIRHTIAIVAVLAALLVSAPSVLAAQHVIHYRLTFSEESSLTLSEEIASCVGYEGMIHEERLYDVRVTEFVDGPRAGNVYLTGVVSGPFTIEPHDPEAGPVYQGAIREKISFSGTSFDDPLVFTFLVHATATGSNGSSIKFLYHGHGVIGRNGEVKLEFDKVHCIQPGA